jgi:hypothetical protein
VPSGRSSSRSVPSPCQAARDERPARGRVEPEAGGVALVALSDWLVGAFLGQVLAGQLRIEPVEVALPSRGCLGGQLRITRDVSEDERGAFAFGTQREPEHVGAEPNTSPSVGVQSAAAGIQRPSSAGSLTARHTRSTGWAR